MTTTWFIDGVALDQPGKWEVSALTMPATPASQTVAELRLPSRSGVVAKRLSWGTGTQRLSLLVFGGVVEPRAAELRALLGRARVLTKREPGRSSLSVDAVSALVSDPVRVGVEAWRVEATLTLQPFWRETDTLTSPVVSPGSVVFAQWAGSTGDVQDGILRVKGPLTKCSITGRGGVSFERALTAAQYVYVDVSAFRAWYSTSASAWTPTSTAVLLDYPASGPLVLEPSAAGVALSMSGDGFVTTGTAAETTGITLRGGRYWL